jgi:hypothetical protein
MILTITHTDLACEIEPGDGIIYDGSPYTVHSIESTEEGFVFTLLDRFEDEVKAFFDYDDEIEMGWEEIL